MFTLWVEYKGLRYSVHKLCSVIVHTNMLNTRMLSCARYKHICTMDLACYNPSTNGRSKPDCQCKCCEPDPFFINLIIDTVGRRLVRKNIKCIASSNVDQKSAYCEEGMGCH